MRLAKNLGGKVGVKENFFFWGGGFKICLKILLQICNNHERSQKFFEKMSFFNQNVYVNVFFAGSGNRGSLRVEDCSI
jgi:Na+/phosphate symporter